MSNGSVPFQGFSLQLAASTATPVIPGPHANTKEVVIYNTDTDAVLYVAVRRNDRVGVIDAFTATIVPAGGSFSFCIGVEGNRNVLGPDLADGFNIYLLSPGTPLVNITFIQCQGASIGGC